MNDAPAPAQSTVFSAEHSPLHEAETNSLDELWTRIDLHLTQGMPREIYETDVVRVTEYLRAQRVRFKEEEAAGIKQTGKRASSASKKQAEDIVAKLKNTRITF